jgi:hypothetical protein
VCQESDAACAGTAVGCARTADCPAGSICCGTEVQSGSAPSYTALTCKVTCTDTTMPGAVHNQFCDPAGTDCPSGKTCSPSSVLSGFSICK